MVHHVVVPPTKKLWFFVSFWIFFLEKIILRIAIYSNIFIFMTVTNNIYQKQIKYHVFNAVTNSKLTELHEDRFLLHASFCHAESVCFKSVIQSGRSLFLSKIKIPEFLKFVGPIGPRGQKIMRSANNVGNAGPHVNRFGEGNDTNQGRHVFLFY
jgi:hypothetical protein